MKVYNRHGYLHQHTMGMDVAGREYFSLVIKGTWAFPDTPGAPMRKLPETEQTPLVMADQHTGDPGFSATLWETDFAFRKPACDVVVQGAAYAPNGQKAERVQVGIRIGDWHKTLMVVGHREWRVVGPAVMATDPYPFSRQPFSYDVAFGGTDTLDPDVDNPHAYAANPVGRGYATPRNQDRLSGAPLPLTEEPGVEITSPYEDYRPMALGPISRARSDRLKWAGTYDQKWQDEVFPFLPRDFDERYYQQVGEDQQIASPMTGTPVTTLNLTPKGREQFQLPQTDLPVRLFREWEEAYSGIVRPDTLLFDTEARRMSMVWRVAVPMKRIVTEITEAWIGVPARGLERAKQLGKAYQPRGSRFRMPGEIPSPPPLDPEATS